MKRYCSTIMILVLTVCIFSEALGKSKLTYVDLIEMLTDLERLATLPAEGETTRQWSSYDRTSYYDEQTGKYINWEANGDGFGGAGWIREEQGSLVLAEMEGPGCIWRIWSATPKQGHVKIYLDGQTEPVVDLPFADYFNGKSEPFNRSALVHIVASGKNSYIPIPFQKSCKIVADKDYGEFHHFTYTLFPKGTNVPTFSRSLTKEESAALDKANELLSNCGPGFSKRRPGQQTESFTVNPVAGQKAVVTKICGSRAITSLVLKGDIPSDVKLQRQVLRELVLQISWDGEDTPSVWCPLGDFFGTAPGVNYYRSLPLGVTEDVFYSNWFMPFSSEARIELINEGSFSSALEFEVTHVPLSRPIEEYGRFHAKWHRDAFLPVEKERWIDWPMLKTTGRGRFCGVELEVWNPRGGWWGEGDEKFFVDGEKFPSTYGTGSEDYFGYAWSNPTLWENCYHNQTISEDNKGHTSVNRWHIADNVPFQSSFEGCIEKYYRNNRPTLYSCVAYWYQAPGGIDPYGAVPLSERVGWYKPPQYPLDIAGIFVLENPAGSIEAQGMGGFRADKWSHNEQLWWIGEANAKLRIGIEVAEDGYYKILTRHTKAQDYGIIQWWLNGQKIGKPMDLYYSDDVIATEEIDLGTYQLTAGKHELNVEIVGINPDAIKSYMVGIDYIKVEADEIREAPAASELIKVGDFQKIYDPSVGEQKKWYINDHCFILGDGLWHLFGITHAEPANPIDEDNLAHATAANLTQSPWEKEEYALSVDADWKEEHLWAPHVIFHKGLYYMYYCAGDKDNTKYRIHLATSKNLYDWTRHRANPVIVDGYDARDPYVLRLKDKWVIYYTATSEPGGGNHVVCCQTSDDLIGWKDKRIVFTDPSTGTWGGPTESPTVVRRGKYYYLFIGPRGNYTTTCVYKSKDPFNWSIEQEVARINSHAAEVIRDIDGNWYVSHCGWGQGGVYLAPLQWNDGVDEDDTSLPAPANAG